MRWIFGDDHLQVFHDIDTGFVEITVKHQSPFVAQAWAELIVSQINYLFRSKSKLEAEAAINYLNIEMAQTSFAEIKFVNNDTKTREYLDNSEVLKTIYVENKLINFVTK